MLRTSLLTSVAFAIALPTFAQEVNLYSSRHYDTDERLYSDFEAATGITVNRIEGNADELIARMKAEGENSPADVIITVDASRVWRAEQEGLFQPIDSAVLNDAIPAALRDPAGNWFGFSQRARMIFASADRVTDLPETYADLANPAYEGMVCIRSSTNTYNQTLLASIIANEGEEAARAWATGIVANMARAPEGGDTDQLRGIVSGECDLAVANSYYFARGLAGGVDGLSDEIDAITPIFPNQQTTGTHVNISAAGVAVHAPNRDNAVAFLEYLAGTQAQEYFANGNNEYPAVAGVAPAAVVSQLGDFQADDANLAEIAANIPLAQQIFNEVGWE